MVGWDWWNRFERVGELMRVHEWLNWVGEAERVNEWMNGYVWLVGWIDLEGGSG